VDTFGNAEVVANVNSTSDDVHPYVLPEGLTLYFASTRVPNGIYVAERSSARSSFPTPTRLDEIDTFGDESHPAVTPDNRTLYFCSRRPGGQGGYDLWTASRSSTLSPFGNPVNVAEINTAAFECPDWISADGCRLYFESDQGEPADAAPGAIRHVYFAQKPR
jgi:Tol biopolymer transport system component